MRAAVAFAVLLGVGACDRAAGSDAVIPAAAEPFDGRACPQVLAEYAPHPRNRQPDDPYRWVMRPIQKDTASTDERTVFEIRDRATDRLLTTLTLVHTWSNGFSRPYVFSEAADGVRLSDGSDTSGALQSLVVYLDRDLSHGTGDGAAYAILFPDLAFHQHYLHRQYEKIGGLVFHTPEKVLPLIPDMWTLTKCGPPAPAAAAVNVPATRAPDSP